MSVKHAASVIDSANKCVDVWMCRHSTRKKKLVRSPRSHVCWLQMFGLIFKCRQSDCVRSVYLVCTLECDISNQRENASSDLDHRFLPNFCHYYHQSTLCLNCLAIVNALGRCHCYLLSIPLWVCVCLCACLYWPLCNQAGESLWHFRIYFILNTTGLKWDRARAVGKRLGRCTNGHCEWCVKWCKVGREHFISIYCDSSSQFNVNHKLNRRIFYTTTMIIFIFTVFLVQYLPSFTYQVTCPCIDTFVRFEYSNPAIHSKTMISLSLSARSHFTFKMVNDVISEYYWIIRN